MTDDASMRRLEDFLHDQIPLTRAMGVAVEVADPTELVLTAPLEPNRNHLGTAFGGSLSAIATLAGYSMLWMRLEQTGLHLVIRESTLRYLHPVRQGIRAICPAPEPAEFSEFLSVLRDKRRARIRLDVTVEEEGRVCVAFSGEFVAVMDPVC
jgi:thioesterase domain-containing protein